MSIKMNTLIWEIEQIAPRELEESWDNCGMQVAVAQEEVNRILVALEITGAVVQQAKALQADFIVVHHPLIFQPIRKIDHQDVIGNYLIDLIQSGISVYAAHTSFDEAVGGNNEYLAQLIGLKEIRRLKAATGTEDYPAGRMGEFERSLSLSEVAALMGNTLPIAREMRVVGNPEQMITTVGLCTGAGSSVIEAAIWNRCDLFITGDLRYHEAQTARESGLCLIDGGHYGTESIFAENFTRQLQARVGDQVEILASGIDQNPFSSNLSFHPTSEWS